MLSVVGFKTVFKCVPFEAYINVQMFGCKNVIKIYIIVYYRNK